MISNLIDFRMNPGDAVRTPRFGMFSVDIFKRSVDLTRNFLDMRFSRSEVNAAGELGIMFDQTGVRGFVDTGMPVVVQIDGENQRLGGMVYEQMPGYAIGY